MEQLVMGILIAIGAFLGVKLFKRGTINTKLMKFKEKDLNLKTKQTKKENELVDIIAEIETIKKDNPKFTTKEVLEFWNDKDK